MPEITLDPNQSYELWEIILANRTENSILFEDLEISRKWIDQIYDIIITNRAKTKGTVLHIQTDDGGAITNIEGEAVKIQSEEIKTPRWKPGEKLPGD